MCLPYYIFIIIVLQLDRPNQLTIIVDDSL